MTQYYYIVWCKSKYYLQFTVTFISWLCDYSLHLQHGSRDLLSNLMSGAVQHDKLCPTSHGTVMLLYLRHYLMDISFYKKCNLHDDSGNVGQYDLLFIIYLVSIYLRLYLMHIHHTLQNHKPVGQACFNFHFQTITQGSFKYSMKLDHFVQLFWSSDFCLLSGTN